MSEDQIFELIKMTISAIVGIFGGYYWAKSSIKIDISQTQYNDLKSSINVSTKEINSQITELNNIGFDQTGSYYISFFLDGEVHPQKIYFEVALLPDHL